MVREPNVLTLVSHVPGTAEPMRADDTSPQAGDFDAELGLPQVTHCVFFLVGGQTVVPFFLTVVVQGRVTLVTVLAGHCQSASDDKDRDCARMVKRWTPHSGHPEDVRSRTVTENKPQQ